MSKLSFVNCKSERLDKSQRSKRTNNMIINFQRQVFQTNLKAFSGKIAHFYRNALPIIYLCFNKASDMDRGNNSAGEDREEYTIYNTKIKLPDEETIMVMLKASYWYWGKVQNPEESALKVTYTFVRYLSTTEQQCAKLNANIKLRDFVCAEKDQGIV